jgi:cytochrome c553
VGTFAVGPANMNEDSEDTVISPTAAICTGCHDSTSAAQHMLDSGNAVFSAPPAGFVPVGHVQPYSVTPLTKGSATTPGTYLYNAARGTGPGVETCVNCHGPGGIEDVSKVHRVGQ